MIIQYTKPCRETLKQLMADLNQLKEDYQKQRLAIEEQIELLDFEQIRLWKGVRCIHNNARSSLFRARFNQW